MCKRKVRIEYGKQDDCRKHFEKLMGEIKATVIGIDIAGKVGKDNCFDVTLNGELIYSRAEEGRFPEHDDIIIFLGTGIIY